MKTAQLLSKFRRVAAVDQSALWVAEVTAMARRVRVGTTAAILSLLAACGEDRYSHYPNYTAAVDAGAVDRGWLPSYVPTSATEIAEAHDIDLNTQRLRFRLPPSEARAMVAAMEPVPLGHLSQREPRPRLPTLPGPWPKELESGGTPVGGSIDSLHAYVVRDATVQPRCIAVDWATHTVYAWSCGARAAQ